MPYIDIFILFIILISLLIGFYKGFVREVLSLATLILSLLAAYYLSKYLVGWLPASMITYNMSLFNIKFDGYWVMLAVIFTVIFISTMLLGRILTNAISSLISESPLNVFNRLLGGVFGLARAGVLIIIFVMLLGLTRFPASTLWQEANMLPLFVDGAKYALSFLPPQHSNHFSFDQSTTQDRVEDELYL